MHHHQAQHYSTAPQLLRGPVAAIFLAAALWGIATSGTKYALGGFPPMTLLLIELVAATATLWVTLAIRGYRGRPPWRLALVLGLLEPALAYVADTVGLSQTSAANAAIITGLECTFVVLLAAVFLRERMSGKVWVAAAVGLLGLLALEQVTSATHLGRGDLYVLVGALSAAAYTIVGRHIGDDCDALTLTAYQFTVATALILPVAIAAWASGAEQLHADVAPRYWIAAAVVGIGGFAMSFLLYNWAIAIVDARSAAVLLNLIPAFGLASAVIWLDERLTPARAAGAVLIGASVALFTRSELRHGDLETPIDVAPLEEVPLCN